MGENATARIPRTPDVARPAVGSLKVLVWLVVLVAIYAYGWRVTQINLVELATKWHLARPLLNDLVHPNLLQRYPILEIAEGGVGLDGTPPPPSAASGGSQRITLSTNTPKIGDSITVRGEGFTPSRPGELIWRDQAGASATIGKFATDTAGRFETVFTVPKVIGTEHHVVAQVTLEGTRLGPSDAARRTLYRMVETVFLALMGTTLAIVLAIPLSFLGAKNLMSRTALSQWVYYVVRTFFNIARSVEPIIIATVFAVWVGIGPFAGVLALAVHSIAALGKLYSEQIESIDPGPIEAITATGASMLQIVRFAVIPQIVPPFIAFTIYRWDTNVRMSTIIGFVGGGGLGFLLFQYIQLLLWREASTAILGIILIVGAMDFLSAKVREKVV